MGLTLDTGALIALERGERRMLAVWDAALRTRARITVPAPVIAEWWRGQRGPMARIFDAADIEPLDEAMARTAGLALAHIRNRAGSTDAIVMASAASRGDIVYTSDVGDLMRLQRVFPSVRVLSA